MPQLPEDIIDRLTQMERRIQQLSTAVNNRPALNQVTNGSVHVNGGVLEVSNGAVEIVDGASLLVQGPNLPAPTLRVGTWDGSEYGMEIHRQTGSLAMTLYNGDGTSGSKQPLRIYDSANREIISDDITTGGLARPWMVMVPPQDVALSRGPQTTSTSWTTIAMSYNTVWQPKMRLRMTTGVSSGAAGQIRVLVNGTQWGTTVTAPTEFDQTALISADFASVYTSTVKIEVQGIVTSASGTVYATPTLMHGRQS
ncbi:hypothetical protein [Streptomyces sp. A012304]|uniref:hypothetical protein n=1 Tax=Streptomyces sp. A012304 TaxID=375446 RepID=UPI0022325F61|nr:hypothetical protein [Streptomyces sp. A012304]GKQ35662.1 hypothetical protein ALMP_22050 [Streptomyces sp. A012304]